MTPISFINTVLRRIAFVGIFLFASQLVAQNLSPIIKFQVDGSGFDGSRVTITEDGAVKEVFDPGRARMTPQLNFGKKYVITFEKAGYITKRVEISTKNVPEDLKEDDLDFDFAVEIFEQYEGVNTVIFNQPVAKWYYDPKEDGFAYDTDYTKSIRSALANFEKEYETAKVTKPKADDTALKAEEARLAAEAKAKLEEEKRLAAETKAKLEEEKRVAAEAKAAEDARKLAEQEKQKAEAEKNKQAAELAKQAEAEELKQEMAQAKADEEKRQANLKAEEDTRAALKAKEEEEKRLANAKAEEESKKAADMKAELENKAAGKAKLDDEARAQKKAELEEEMRQDKLKSAEEEKRRAQIEKEEIEKRQRDANALRAKEEKLAAENAAEQEKRRQESALKEEEENRKKATEDAAFEAVRKQKAKEAFEADQRGNAQAQSVGEAQSRERSEALAKMQEERKSLSIKDAGNVVSRTEETIEEVNRTIKQITIQREHMTYKYKKIVYNWGGVYFFRDEDSITEGVFKLETTE
ncbi:MAG: hypothetical protein K9G46_12425 [Flavobacteriales bacterium]|nr:hypothetical protein [Flavobacteriales bacterium]